MVRIPVYFERPVETREISSAIRGELVVVRFTFDTTGGAATMQAPGFRQPGFVYRIAAIHHHVICGGNGYIRYSIRGDDTGPAVNEDPRSSECLSILTNARDDHATISDNGAGTTTTVGTQDWKSIQMPLAFWFDEKVGLEIIMSASSFAMLNIIYEKVRL